MKLNTLFSLALVAGSIASTTSAEEYQTLIDLNYLKINAPISSFDEEGYFLSGTHFFSPKETIGPLGEFEYINKSSRAFASYSDFDNFDSSTIGGDFITENFLVGASYSESEGFDTKRFNLGYFITENFLINAVAYKPDSFDTEYRYSAQYNHELNGNDYLGFTYTTDDDFDNQSISSTYFTHLGDNQYFKATVSYHDSEFDDFWSTRAAYYFNKTTSVVVGYDDDEDITVGFEHFFNENYALSAEYIESGSNSSTEIYQVTFSARF